MTEGERIVLGDEGEGESDDSDPVLVTGEASVGGSAGVSSGPSGFSHSTIAPGFSGASGATPAAPQARILAPRIDILKKIFRELARKTLVTTQATPLDVREAVTLMKSDIAQGNQTYIKNVPKFEAWLAKQDQAYRSRSFGYDHIPAHLPAHLANVVPPEAMHRAGAPAANNPVAQFTSLFETANQHNADAKNMKALLETVQGRGFGVYPLPLNGVPFPASRVIRG